MLRKINIVFIFFLLVFLWDLSFAQKIDLSKKITLELKNVSIEDALNEITLQSGISFSYSSNNYQS